VSASGAPAAYSKPTAIPSAPSDKAIASLCALLLVVSLPINWLNDPSMSDQLALGVALLINLGLLAAVFQWFVAEERVLTERTARSALITGVVAVLLLPIFWTGLMFPVGAGALALGLGGHRAGANPRDAKATVGALLGAIAVVGGFVLLLVG
jgi:hypothetical protein